MGPVRGRSDAQASCLQPSAPLVAPRDVHRARRVRSKRSRGGITTDAPALARSNLAPSRPTRRRDSRGNPRPMLRGDQKERHGELPRYVGFSMALRRRSRVGLHRVGLLYTSASTRKARLRQVVLQEAFSFLR